MHTKAYWIFPDHKVLETSSHHQEVIKSPQIFGETVESVRETYKKYGEKLGLEAKARDEILTRVIQRGFIRIRENRNNWSVQVWKLTDETRDRIHKWAKAKAVYNQVRDKYAHVKVTEVSKFSSIVFACTFDELASGSKRDEESQGEK
ncbi:MAG: hypothetical protein ACFFFT_16105 [Candidatus Thorarchaeota archaeon]